nr:MAG TPA: hypothetical protein [Caudoviricetes sp.]
MIHGKMCYQALCLKLLQKIFILFYLLYTYI